MKSKQLLEMVKCKSITVPLYLYWMKDDLNLDADTFFFLLYLVHEGNNVSLDINQIKDDLKIDSNTIMENISILTEKRLLEVEVSKNKNDIMEESISLDGFWNQVVKIMIEKFNEDVDNDETIYDKIQKEFGRMLSPMEYEIIGAWIDSNISEELIYEAVKEAVFNGVNNLRYIDKILYEWGKKGYKNKMDVDAQRRNWNSEKKETSVTKKEVFDYNWLEDDEDE